LHFGSALAVFFNHLFRGAADEINIVEFGVNLDDFRIEALNIFGQALALGLKINNALERQSRDDRANDQLRRTCGRGRCKADIGQARQTADGFIPKLHTRFNLITGGDKNKRDLRGGWHIHLRAHGSNLRDKIDNPTNLGFNSVILKA
jgi:hypothetical protein